jgi:pyrimidine-nucleoside phosphorylase
VASLLAKKLAVGIRTVGLDIRVAAHGNFGGDMDAARINAQLFNHIAGMLGVTSTCFLTSADHPYQPYIGRGEAIVAIYRLFSGTSEPWLNRHAGHCAWMASATVGALPRPASSLAYKEVLQANIIAQGGTIDAFRRKAEEVQQGHQLAVRARAPGFPKIDLEQVRKVLVDAQRALTGHGPYPDPAGVIIIAEGTAPVDVGAPILTVRADDWSSGIFDKISSCVTTVPNPPAFVGVAVHG